MAYCYYNEKNITRLHKIVKYISDNLLICESFDVYNKQEL